MKVLAIDFEATCWDHKPTYSLETVVDPVSEIIEVGMAMLDTETGEIVREQHFVKPIASEVSLFCTTLTGITQDQLDREGLSKVDAWDIMRRRGKKSRYWTSWGFYDLRKLLDDSTLFGEKMPLSPTWHVNMKSAFGMLFLNGKSGGLGAAIEKMGLEFEGRPHCGADDAVNLARIVRELHKRTDLGLDKQ